jgi:hypothetical protein
MQIIPAPWEKRNLGLSCDEVTVEPADDIAALDQGLALLVSQYQVVKSPCARPDLLLHLQGRGFMVMEVLSSCYHDGQFPTLSRPQTKMLDSLSCAPATAHEQDLIAEQIRGGMFDTDRVAIDPRLGPALAAQRYAGWLGDEVARGATVYCLSHKAAPVGFFVMRSADNHVWHAILGGIFPAYQRYGFGFFMNYLEIALAMGQGAKRVFTAFSSNNPAIAAIHYALGYRLHQQHYVLVKHKP